jgi:hypothetical protein
MTILLSVDDIKRIVSGPTKLPPSSSADDYQMERYQRVAREAVVTALRGVLDPLGECPPIENRQASCAAIDENCPACWCAYLEREAK